MHSELIALGDNGRLYSWSWEKSAKPSNLPHSINSRFFPIKGKLLIYFCIFDYFFLDAETTELSESEKIIDIESCTWRSIILTSTMRVGSFMDLACGEKIQEVFFEKLIDIPDGEDVEKMHASLLFSAVQTTNNSVYWRGIYPFNERRKLFEKARTKIRKHVTFDTTEIVEGCEVRTKSTPIYSAGSVAINFTSGKPLVRIIPCFFCFV